MSAELLAAILSDPDDAAHRQVYGDALQSAGDPRGELIALELANTRAPRRNELRRLYGATWWPELATRFVRTRGGFVDAIAVRSTELERSAPLFAREPIRALEVWTPGLTPAQAARLPELPALTLRELEVASWEAFLGSPAAVAVESLATRGQQVTGDVLPACRRLCIDRFGGPGDLAGWDHVGRLQMLDASCCESLEAGELIDFLARAEQLAWLRLSGGPLRGTGLGRALDAHPALRHLELVDCDLSRREIDALRADAPSIEIFDAGQSRSVIDLVGHVFEVVPDRDTSAGFRLELDGEVRTFETTLSETYSVWGGRLESTPERVAQALVSLAGAIANGWPRRLTASGFELVHDPPPRDQRSTFEVALPDPPAPIQLAFDYYVD